MPDNDWKVKVNSQYQDAMKTILNLSTASLVFPAFLVRNFLDLPAGQPLKEHLNGWAYSSWCLLFLSILSSMLFLYFSAKFVKVVSGGTERHSEKFYETARDAMIFGSIICFVVGLLLLSGFFETMK
jgi:hypothetical protein